jgi:23S rRNA (adenine-N6)-dimethyltransferase
MTGHYVKGARPAMPRARRDPVRGSSHTAACQRDHNRRTLSQNFLRGSSAVRLYLSMVALEVDSLVLEVGAGDGAITEVVAPMCRELRAYEIDPFHARKLEARLGHYPNVRVVVGDFLAAKPPRERFAVIGNVPFSITSQVINWCLTAPALSTATIITQLEYAKKRTGGYGRWSLRTIETWPWFSWELRGLIPRHEFRPAPRIDGAVLYLARRDRPLVPPARRAAYGRMVELGFGGVGGSLYQSLARRHPTGKVAAAFREAGVDRDAVVAYVTPEEWLRIFELLSR